MSVFREVRLKNANLQIIDDGHVLQMHLMSGQLLHIWCVLNLGLAIFDDQSPQPIFDKQIFFFIFIILYLYSAYYSIDSKRLWHSFLICATLINLRPIGAILARRR